MVLRDDIIPQTRQEGGLEFWSWDAHPPIQYYHDTRVPIPYCDYDLYCDAVLQFIAIFVCLFNPRPWEMLNHQVFKY